LIWIVTAVIFGVSALITSLLIPKTNTLEKSNVKVTDIWKIPQTIWRLGGKNWILLLIVGCFWGFSSHLVETSIVDSLVKRFNIMDTKASLTTNILMGGYIILFLLPLIWSTNKIKYKWTSIITSGIYCLFCILLAILPKFNWIYFIVLFGGIGNILLSTLQIALPANRVPKGKEASFLGIFFVFGTILKPVATLIQGLILENKEANTNVGIFGGYPWVFLIAGLIMLLTIIPLSLIQDKKNDIKNNKEKSVTL
jgi:MFS family permease